MPSRTGLDMEALVGSTGGERIGANNPANIQLTPAQREQKRAQKAARDAAALAASRKKSIRQARKLDKKEGRTNPGVTTTPAPQGLRQIQAAPSTQNSAALNALSRRR